MNILSRWIIFHKHILLSCQFQVAAYGKCITVKAEVEKNVCSKEFQDLKNCIKEAVWSFHLHLLNLFISMLTLSCVRCIFLSVASPLSLLLYFLNLWFCCKSSVSPTVLSLVHIPSCCEILPFRPLPVLSQCYLFFCCRCHLFFSLLCVRHISSPFVEVFCLSLCCFKRIDFYCNNLVFPIVLSQTHLLFCSGSPLKLWLFYHRRIYFSFAQVFLCPLCPRRIYLTFEEILCFFHCFIQEVSIFMVWKSSASHTVSNVFTLLLR